MQIRFSSPFARIAPAGLPHYKCHTMEVKDAFPACYTQLVLPAGCATAASRQGQTRVGERGAGRASGACSARGAGRARGAHTAAALFIPWVQIPPKATNMLPAALGTARLGIKNVSEPNVCRTCYFSGVFHPQP